MYSRNMQLVDTLKQIIPFLVCSYSTVT